MTTLDHPDLLLSDKRDQIMQAVQEVIDADHAAAQRRHEQAANAAIEACLPHISAFLEDYGTDPGNGIVAGACTDPAHALAWVTTAAGFSFDITEGQTIPYTWDSNARANRSATECWLLHPLTGERVYRIDYQAKWEHAARAIHAADQATTDIGEPDPPAEHPADALVAALRAFVESLADREAGF